MNNRKFLGGFTLVELLVTLAVVAVITSITVPSMNNLVQRSQRHSAVSEAIALINLARNTAIMEQRTITVCPLDLSHKCVAEWNTRPITVFRDDNSDRILDDSADIIRVGTIPENGYWTGNTASRPYLRFFPNGMASYAIGNMVWCPSNRDSKLAAQIVINMGGRPRLSEDHDDDGLIEDANGNAVNCS
ncbi:MAG: GspH/FimT family pseudopilin [Pseudomonadota bacterium]|nr:GspH/FimT family pseudopilin [Pseudomonadota bacterium]